MRQGGPKGVGWQGPPARPVWLALGRLLLRFVVITLVVGALPSVPTTRAQSGVNQAGLVVLHGDGHVVTACVAFDEAEISGLQLLQRSGLDLNVDTSNGMGGTVCRINGEGCSTPQESCFCHCTGSDCAYWSYWRSSAAGWEYSNLGGGNTVVRPGDVDGWVWGPGTVDNAPQPPALALSDICQAAAATATPSATPAPTETPTETPTPIPSLTPTPLPTATYTPLPTSPPTATSTPLNTSTAAATWTPPSPITSPPRIELFAADRTQITAGETTTLQWQVVDAAGVVLRAGAQAVAVNAVGATTLAPPQSVEVWLEASNSGGTSRSVVQVTVVTPSTVPPTAPPPAMTMPPTIAPTVAPTPARVLLPLVMVDAANKTAMQPTANVNTAAPAASAATPTITPTVASIAAAPTAVPTVAATATAAAALPTPASKGNAAAASGADPKASDQTLLNLFGTLLLTLAALLVLPAGIGTVGYLLWRAAKRTDRS